ncbi:MAG: hypothetical protein FWG62_08870 [Proteobacteria bacterium]|nr:hypothetical protein [Pseudomonadota bacterium]
MALKGSSSISDVGGTTKRCPEKHGVSGYSYFDKGGVIWGALFHGKSYSLISGESDYRFGFGGGFSMGSINNVSIINDKIVGCCTAE